LKVVEHRFSASERPGRGENSRSALQANWNAPISSPYSAGRSKANRYVTRCLVIIPGGKFFFRRGLTKNKVLFIFSWYPFCSVPRRGQGAHGSNTDCLRNFTAIRFFAGAAGLERSRPPCFPAVPGADVCSVLMRPKKFGTHGPFHTQDIYQGAGRANAGGFFLGRRLSGGGVRFGWLGAGFVGGFRGLEPFFIACRTKSWMLAGAGPAELSGGLLWEPAELREFQIRAQAR